MKVLFFCCVHIALFGLYSESNQDTYVFENFFKDKQSPGVFVDVGSHDGISCSNSYFFEKHLNWNGLCIEPNPDLFRQLREHRSCFCSNVACSDRAGDQLFVLHPCSFVSGLSEFLSEEHKRGFGTRELLASGAAKEVFVPCESLNNLLDRYHLTQIDFLTIDTEGADFSILTSIDFDRFDIKVIAIEGFPSEFQDFMEGKQYVSFGRIGNDAIFVKNDFLIHKDL